MKQKYYISTRYYRAPNVFKQFEGWSEWTDYSTTYWCNRKWIFNNKRDAEKTLKKLKREENYYEKVYGYTSTRDYKIIEYNGN